MDGTILGEMSSWVIMRKLTEKARKRKSVNSVAPLFLLQFLLLGSLISYLDFPSFYFSIEGVINVFLPELLLIVAFTTAKEIKQHTKFDTSAIMSFTFLLDLCDSRYYLLFSNIGYYQELKAYN